MCGKNLGNNVWDEETTDCLANILDINERGDSSSSCNVGGNIDTCDEITNQINNQGDDSDDDDYDDDDDDYYYDSDDGDNGDL